MSAELDAMRAQISELQSETRGFRRQRFWWGVAIVLVIAAYPATSGTAMPPDLVCKSLKVLGPDGKVAAEIRPTAHGGQLDVNGNDGKERAHMGVDDDGTGILVVSGTDSEQRVLVGVCEHGDGIVNLNGKRGEFIALLGGDEAGNGQLTISTKDGKERGSLEIDDGGNGRVAILGTNDKNAATILVDKGNGVLELHGASGTTKRYSQ